jgi:glycine/D-amino acid oxidase-like deaminating enzyme
VVVIGGGVGGYAILYWLTKLGWRAGPRARLSL